jgi:hypothetical protein
LDIGEAIRRQLVPDLLLGDRSVPEISRPPEKSVAAYIDAAPARMNPPMIAAMSVLFIELSSVLEWHQQFFARHRRGSIVRPLL